MDNSENTNSDWVFTKATPILSHNYNQGRETAPFRINPVFASCGNGHWRENISKINHAIVRGKIHMEDLLQRGERVAWFEVQVSTTRIDRKWDFLLGVDKGWEEEDNFDNPWGDDKEFEPKIEYIHEVSVKDPLIK